MNLKPGNRRELGEVLRELASAKPANEAELAHLERGAILLAAHLQRHAQIAGVPEIVWHFLSDVDLRFKSPEYAQLQQASLLDTLDRWND